MFVEQFLKESYWTNYLFSSSGYALAAV